MIWLLEKNISHFTPVRFLTGQFIHFFTRRIENFLPFIPQPKLNLRDYELTYMTWWDVFWYLWIETILWPAVFGIAMMQFFACWWIYFGYWTAREVVFMIF